MRVTSPPYMHEGKHKYQMACRKGCLRSSAERLGPSACSQPADIKTNVSSDHMKENSKY